MKRFCLLLLLVALGVAGSRAQDRRQIERASYGSGQFWVDVTPRVRSLIRDNDLHFRVDNQTLGVGSGRWQRKTLRLQVRENDGSTQELTFRENEDVSLRGYGGVGGLEITRGSYGAGDRRMDVTDRMNSQKRDGQLILLVSNAAMGGDPAEGEKKTLTVWYINEGHSAQATLQEGDTLNLPGPQDAQRQFGDDQNR
jgi:hypothetical protein